MVKRRGYTLVEIMTVMGLIGILSATSVQVYQRSSLTAREALLRQQLQQVRDALDRCYADTGLWPDPATLDDATAPSHGWVPDRLRGPGWSYAAMDPARWQGPYLKRVPNGPAISGGTPLGMTTLTGGWAWNGHGPVGTKHPFYFNSTAVGSDGTQYFTW